MSGEDAAPAPSSPELKKAQIQPNSYPAPGPSGNTVGLIVPKTSPLLTAPNNAPETRQEDWFDKFLNGAGEKARWGAQKYLDYISQPLHTLGGETEQLGGKVAEAGGAVFVGGAVATATVAGSEVGVPAMGVGGAAMGVGAATSGLGAGMDSAATAFDKAANWILTGQPPDWIQAAKTIGSNALMALVASKIGQLPGGAEAVNLAGAAMGIGGGGGGGYIMGQSGPCIVGPYEQIKNECGQGQQAHHILPD